MVKEYTLSQALESFMLNCRAERKSPKTMRGYRDVIKRFISSTGDIKATELVPDHIREYIASLTGLPGKVAGSQYSSHTMMKHYQVIRTWVKWMYAQELIPTCPTDKTKAPRLGDRLPSVLTDEEVQAIFRYLKEVKGRYRDEVIFTLFLDTGMRLEEVANLKVSDVHIEDGWIHIASGKGDKEAVVPLGNRCARDLYTYIHRHRKAKPGEQRVFIGRDGNGLSYHGLALMIRKVIGAIRIGDGKSGPHVLRHTMATNFLRAGGNMETLRRILRHNDIKVTQVYAHLANEDILMEHRLLSPLDFVYRQQGRR